MFFPTLDSAIISISMDCKGGVDPGRQTGCKGGKKQWKKMPVLCQEYMLFFSLPLSIQPRLNTQQQGRAPRCGAPPLVQAAGVNALAQNDLVSGQCRPEAIAGSFFAELIS